MSHLTQYPLGDLTLPIGQTFLFLPVAGFISYPDGTLLGERDLGLLGILTQYPLGDLILKGGQTFLSLFVAGFNSYPEGTLLGERDLLERGIFYLKKI